MDKNNDASFILNSKSALPNKLLQDNGTITDITGKIVATSVDSYKAKPALPNKFLNPDGTYSTLNEIIASMVDTDLFIMVNELPAKGENNKIYLLVDGDELVEYIWVNNKWDPVGTVDIDISQYSTTEEMNQAIATALQSAKDYTDAQLENIKFDYQVFVWDGAVDSTGVKFWNDVIKATSETSAIIYNPYENDTNILASSAFITKGSVSPTKTIYRLSFTPYNMTTEDKNYLSKYQLWRNVVVLRLTNGVVTSVDKGTYNSTIEYLKPGVNYLKPYVPEYDGSPATKKYVDDEISAKITQVLGGSY